MLKRKTRQKIVSCDCTFTPNCSCSSCCICFFVVH